MTTVTADLIYAATKHRKTTMLAELAEYVYETTGKKTRIVTADLGGFAPLEAHINAGIIEVWPIDTNSDSLIETLGFAAQGYWPDFDKKVLKKPADNGLEKVGGYGFEGITSFSDAIYDYFKRKGIRLSQDAMFTYKDGATEFRGGSPSHIYEAQNRTVDLIQKSTRIPGLKKVVWTALEARGKDEMGMPQYGPQAIGKALSGKLGPMFGNFLHIEQVVKEAGVDPTTKQVKLETKPVMYLRPHADAATKIPFHAGTRVTPLLAAQLPEYLDPPSLKKLYYLLDELNTKSSSVLMERLAAARKQHETAAVQ